MNLIIIAVLVAALQYGLGWDWRAWLKQMGPIKLFAIWAFAFLPGWLFIRFLGQRAGALWREFVLYLHRLGVDEPQYLPEPPRDSRYYREWVDAGGEHSSDVGTIYQEKFDAYYGKSVSRMTTGGSPWVRTETLFPVFLTTAVFTVAWTAVLWDVSFAAHPSGPTDMLKFGFIGSYSFIIQMLMRRFFQNDLKAGAYASAVLRVFVVAILIAVVHQITAVRNKPEVEAIAAFIIGFFPLAGMQALQRVAAAALRVAVPSLTPAYPLSQIDGLNVWYEARLLEEGIEDMQNLATANLVDVLLHTHVPVGRLIDWVDQAQLYQHLDRTERTFLERLRARRNGRLPTQSEDENHEQPRPDGRRSTDKTGEPRNPSEGARSFREGSRMRHGLRTLGIRTATELLKVVPPDGDPGPIVKWLYERELDGEAVRALSRVLADEPGLNLVRNWQAGAAPVRGVAPRGSQ